MADGIALSKDSIKKAFKAAIATKRRAEEMQQTTERVVREAVVTVESAAGTALSAAVAGRFGEITLPGGLPADAVVGGALLVAGIFEAAGPEMSHHLCAFGQGVFSGAVYRTVFKLADKWRQRVASQGETQRIAAQQAAEIAAAQQAAIAAPEVPLTDGIPAMAPAMTPVEVR